MSNHSSNIDSLTLYTVPHSCSVGAAVHVDRSSSTCSQANLLLDDLKSPLPQPLKTDFILIGFCEQLKKIPDPSISLNLDSTWTHTFTPTSPVRNLGVIFDQNLSFSDHIIHLSRSCFMHIRDLRRIRPICSISKLHLHCIIATSTGV